MPELRVKFGGLIDGQGKNLGRLCPVLAGHDRLRLLWRFFCGFHSSIIPVARSTPRELSPHATGSSTVAAERRGVKSYHRKIVNTSLENVLGVAGKREIW